MHFVGEFYHRPRFWPKNGSVFFENLRSIALLQKLIHDFLLNGHLVCILSRGYQHHTGDLVSTCY